MFKKLSLLFLTVLITVSATTQTVLAPRPPMGWNSWDAYGLTIDESQFRANVDVLARTLKPFGWDYAVIDEGWFLPDPQNLHSGKEVAYEIDENGRYIPVPTRFPSAIESGRNTGFHAIGAFVHAQGLKFGIHIVRGIPRVSTTRNLPIAGSTFRASEVADTSDACPWDPTNWGVKDTPAGQAWYDSLLQQYAAWGVDYLKVDCISDHPYKSAEIRMLHTAIARSGRPIVLSLSPGPTSEGHAAELQKYAQLWRISDDIWDRWKASTGAVYDQFALAAGWVPFARPGSWPDADMLPLGHLGPFPGEGSERETLLTHDEQRTMMTLWAMARSPLILGANLTRLDAWTLSLITNPEVLAIDQASHHQMQINREHEMIAWTSEAGTSGSAPRTFYLALFNTGDTSRNLARPYSFYGLPSGTLAVHDVWARQDQPGGNSFNVTLPAHGVLLYRLQSR